VQVVDPLHASQLVIETHLRDVPMGSPSMTDLVAVHLTQINR
jgi:hypothetical protein